MHNLMLRYGMFAGLIVGVPLFAVAVALKGHPPSNWGMAFGFLTMLLAFSLVFVAIKRQRDALGGTIGFWRAFGLGLGICAVASVFYVLAWEAALAVTGMDFAGAYAEAALKEEQAKGATAEALAKLGAEMETFKRQYAQPLYRVPITLSEIFPLGAVVSLVCAAMLRNPRFLSRQQR